MESSKHYRSFLTHSLRSNGWVFVDMGKTALAEICVDGCDVVSENSWSDVTNWFHLADLSNRWPSSQLATYSKHHLLDDCKALRENFIFKCRHAVNKISPKRICIAYIFKYILFLWKWARVPTLPSISCYASEKAAIFVLARWDVSDVLVDTWSEFG